MLGNNDILRLRLEVDSLTARLERLEAKSAMAVLIGEAYDIYVNKNMQVILRPGLSSEGKVS
jgi:hypothetical protein